MKLERVRGEKCGARAAATGAVAADDDDDTDGDGDADADGVGDDCRGRGGGVIIESRRCRPSPAAWERDAAFAARVPAARLRAAHNAATPSTPPDSQGI